MPEPIFSIQKIYTKNISFDVMPEFDAAFKKQPSENRTEVQINYKSLLLDHHYEVCLILDLMNTIHHQIAFTVKIEQIGIFHIENFSKEKLQQTLEVECPNRLYPYASHTVSQLAVLGGFSVSALQPVNFAVIYDQKKREMLS